MAAQGIALGTNRLKSLALKETSAKVEVRQKVPSGTFESSLAIYRRVSIRKRGSVPSGRLNVTSGKRAQASRWDAPPESEKPGHEWPGYFQSFLRNDRKIGLLQRSPPG